MCRDSYPRGGLPSPASFELPTQLSRNFRQITSITSRMTSRRQACMWTAAPVQEGIVVVAVLLLISCIVFILCCDPRPVIGEQSHPSLRDTPLRVNHQASSRCNSEIASLPSCSQRPRPWVTPPMACQETHTSLCAHVWSCIKDLFFWSLLAFAISGSGIITQSLLG
ncbi:hypothetical protein B0H21DRAFT_347320 [Amylocystis lapponica]|nr:hypothetical protein B0H21DRAFT_347320 [Amylocystis lapponica]